MCHQSIRIYQIDHFVCVRRSGSSENHYFVMFSHLPNKVSGSWPHVQVDREDVVVETDFEEMVCLLLYLFSELSVDERFIQIEHESLPPSKVFALRREKLS